MCIQYFLLILNFSEKKITFLYIETTTHEKWTKPPMTWLKSFQQIRLYMIWLGYSIR